MASTQSLLNSNQSSVLNRTLYDKGVRDLSYSLAQSYPNLVRYKQCMTPYNYSASGTALSSTSMTFNLPRQGFLDDALIEVSLEANTDPVAMSLERSLFFFDEILFQTNNTTLFTINAEYLYARIFTSDTNDKLRYLQMASVYNYAAAGANTNYQMSDTQQVAASTNFTTFIPLFCPSFERIDQAFDLAGFELMRLQCKGKVDQALVNLTSEGGEGSLTYNQSYLWINAHAYPESVLRSIRERNYAKDSSFSFLSYDTLREQSTCIASSYTQTLTNNTNYAIFRQYLMIRFTNTAFTSANENASSFVEPVGYNFQISSSYYNPTSATVSAGNIHCMPKVIQSLLDRKNAYNEICPAQTRITNNWNSVVTYTAPQGIFLFTGPSSDVSLISGAESVPTYEVMKIIDLQWGFFPNDRTFNSGNLSFSQLSQPTHTIVTTGNGLGTNYTMTCISEYWLILTVNSGTGSISRSLQF